MWDPVAGDLTSGQKVHPRLRCVSDSEVVVLDALWLGVVPWSGHLQETYFRSTTGGSRLRIRECPTCMDLQEAQGKTTRDPSVVHWGQGQVFLQAVAPPLVRAGLMPIDPHPGLRVPRPNS